MPLTVIGAGLCRTGTTSLAAALDKLGFGPCYHMRNNVKHGDSAAWIEFHTAAKAGEPLQQLRERCEAIWKKEEGMEYRSACDYPSQVFYKELAEMYPDAKVVREHAHPCLRTDMWMAQIALPRPRMCMTVHLAARRHRSQVCKCLEVALPAAVA
jgi:Sulfotransferase domain